MWGFSAAPASILQIINQTEKCVIFKFCNNFEHSNICTHCKYIWPDYDGTLAIHSTPIVVATMPVVATTMNG